jgi:hypothetical protein
MRMSLPPIGKTVHSLQLKLTLTQVSTSDTITLVLGLVGLLVAVLTIVVTIVLNNRPPTTGKSMLALFCNKSNLYIDEAELAELEAQREIAIERTFRIMLDIGLI